VSCRFSLAVSTVSSFVPVRATMAHRELLLTDPAVQDYRSGFFKRCDSPKFCSKWKMERFPIANVAEARIESDSSDKRPLGTAGHELVRRESDGVIQ
jgi:hypothetical protein